MAEQAPENPLRRVKTWFDEACASDQRNPLAMALSTADQAGRPSARYVLVKQLSLEQGFVVFYTNYASRKAAELENNPFAAGAMYWADFGRQLRLEGPIQRSPATESDQYFASRQRGSQLNAWASEQSQPLRDAADMDRRLEQREREFRAIGSIGRPPFWGGYRLWLEAIEFWCEGADRFHDRTRYERTLKDSGDSQFESSAWQHSNLQP